MVDPLVVASRVAGSGLRAQAIRMRVVSENIANAHTTANSPNGDPYRRKTVSFKDELSRVDGARYVALKNVGVDDTPFRIVRDPGNPSANSSGEVKMPNVDTILELADLRDANHGYLAGLQVTRQSRELFSMTLDVLKG